jgi:hypothetical protein
MDLIASCSSCGARFKFTEKYAGQSVKCPKCPGTIAVPGAGPVGEGGRSAGQESAVGQPGQAALSAAGAAGETQRCPSCGMPLADPEGLCPKCGYDLALASMIDGAAPESKGKGRPGNRLGAKPRSRGRGTRAVWLVTGGAVGVTLLIAGSIWVYAKLIRGMSSEMSQAMLVLEWSPDERFTGAVKIDNRKLAVPESGDVQYPVEPGKHRIVVTREGYEPVDLDLVFGEGQRHHYKPQWSLAKLAETEAGSPEGEAAPGVPSGPAAHGPAPALANFDDWLQDFDVAQKRAAAESKDVMIVFSGSDWCGWSIRLAYEVFLQKDFRARADGRYVLVFVDFPRKSQNKAKKPRSRMPVATSSSAGSFA